MRAVEFREYILDLIFYKYLSEQMRRYADELLRPDGVTYAELNEGSATGAEYLEAVIRKFLIAELQHIGWELNVNTDVLEGFRRELQIEPPI